MRTIVDAMKSYFSAEESRDVQAIMDSFAEEATWRGDGLDVAGLAAIRQIYEASVAEYRGLAVTLEHVTDEGDEGSARWYAVFEDHTGRRFIKRGVNVMRWDGTHITSLRTYADGPLVEERADAAPLGTSPGARFHGKTVLVTGAGNGIGAAIAIQFAREGARVTGADLDVAGLLRVEQRIADLAGSFHGIVTDLTDAGAHSDLIRAAAPHGVLDVLVNNAAVFLLAGEDATDEQWSRTLDVNLLAPAKLVSAALDDLSRADAPAIVNLASISGHVAQPGRWTYNAVKGATLSLTRCQALDLAPRDIRVNSVSPGYIWTDVLDKAAGGDRATWDPVWGSSCPMLRCGEPREVATAVAFLASGDASYITGADLLVDGGSISMAPDALARYSFGE